MNSIKINGNNIVGGKNITIKNGRVIVDGNDVTGEDSKVITIEIIGNVEELSVDACTKVTITGSTGPIKTMSGDVKCGDVNGSVKTMSGDVRCGSIAGDVSTMSGDIEHA